MKTFAITLFLALATLGWGDSITFDNLQCTGGAGNEICHTHRPLSGNTVFFSEQSGQFLSGGPWLGGLAITASSAGVWHGSNFSGTWGGVERTIEGSQLVWYDVSGTYSGSWNGNWKIPGTLTMCITQSTLAGSGTVPEPGTFVLGITGLLGIWNRRKFLLNKF
jgi:hypothetical protein